MSDIQDYSQYIQKVKDDNNTFIIGVDAGGVLFEHKDKNKDSINKHGHNSVDNIIPNSVEQLILIKESLKKKNIDIQYVLVSFAGTKTALETFIALEENFQNIFHSYCFVKNKPSKVIVAEYLGIDIFIDDTLDIFTDKSINNKNMIDLQILCILFSSNENYENIISCTDWLSVAKHILSIDFTKIKSKQPNYNTDYKLIKSNIYSNMYNTTCLQYVKDLLTTKFNNIL